MAGGGGYGSPWIRNPEHVLKDVIEEKVSIEAAREDYGVIIIKNNHSLEIDKIGTNDFRRSLKI
jgi:N-methylhydantoinase B